jgi:hypothetical protein
MIDTIPRPHKQQACSGETLPNERGKISNAKNVRNEALHLTRMRGRQNESVFSSPVFPAGGFVAPVLKNQAQKWGSPPFLLKNGFVEAGSRKVAKTQSLDIWGILPLCNFASLRENSFKSTHMAENRKLFCRVSEFAISLDRDLPCRDIVLFDGLCRSCQKFRISRIALRHSYCCHPCFGSAMLPPRGRVVFCRTPPRQEPCSPVFNTNGGKLAKSNEPGRTSAKISMRWENCSGPEHSVGNS